MNKSEERTCNCGRALEDDDKKNCKLCKLQKRFDDMVRSKDMWESSTKSANADKRALQKKVEKMEYRNKFPCWIHIKEKYWNCTKERLDEILKLVAPLSDLLLIETGRND